MVKRRAQLSSRTDRIFDRCNNVFMALIFFVSAYPLYFTVLASISDINEVALGHVFLWPRGFTLDAYKNVFLNDQIWVGYKNSFLYLIGNTAYTLIILLPTAYALSKKYLVGRGVLTWFFLFTMYFSGGLVASYLLARSLGLLNTRWVLIVGGLPIYYVVVTRTYFQTSIPGEIYESAEIDGASELRSFLNIALPLAVPIIAVMALFIGVGAWNAYFSAMIYVTNKKLFPLQLVLRNILIMNQRMLMDPKLMGSLSAAVQQDMIRKARMAESMKYAVIFIASAPLLIAYPFVQKYFVKGLMVGSLKG